MRSRFSTIFIALCASLLMATRALPASSEGVDREYAVKAAFIYNFAQFVDWPADAFESEKAPIVIGILGTNPFDDSLEQAVQGKTVNGRAFKVEHFSTLDELRPCQILFVSSSQTPHLQELFEKLRGKPVLTIGESQEFPWAGGIIRFYLDESRVRFEVNPNAAETARLKISSKLLSLARIFGGK